MAIDFSRIKFFVEGDADKVFLRDILQIKFSVQFDKAQLDELIVIARGFNGLEKQIDEFKQIEQYKKREGGINIILFDADYSGREINHGFKEKSKYLIEQKARLGIEFVSFLFPDNLNDGTLETLLETCVQHKSIIECWKGFEDCVKSKGNGYNVPANKTKVYAYLECLHGDTKAEKEMIKDKNRNFTERDKWVFDEVDNESIKKMFDFLNLHLSKFESE
ncbi:MAG: hypothetical protein QM530_05450 [Phycisphaerales bacterium]|nr:hypothetical protein [Phycisphaerales bacterium]